MKNKTCVKFICLLFVSLFVISSFSFSAEALSSNRIISGTIGKSAYWSYNQRTKKLTVSGTGAVVSETQWQNSYPWSDFSNNIKSVQFEKGITEIGAFAFNGAKKLKTVTASSTVKKVGAYAFDNTKWLSQQKSGGVYIGKCLYTWKGNVPGGSPSFKKDTYSISDYAFANNYTLSSLTIPSSIKRIGNNAFIWCENLKTVTFKKGVTSLGLSVFSNCTSLKKVTLPSSLKKIPSFAFENCVSLSSIKLPSKITTLSPYAFYKCSKLTSITLSTNLKTMSAEVFDGCTKLKKITVPSKNKYFSTDTSGVLYSKKKLKLYFMPVGKKLTSYKVYSKTTTIASSAFAGNVSLTKLTLPKKLKTISEGVFSGCTNLRSINTPASVTKMDNSAITDTLWYKNKSGIIYFGKVLLDYKGYMANNSWLRVKDGTVSIASYALTDRPELARLTLPDSLKTIGEHAFALCTGLESVTIPASVTYIGQGAFRDCTGFGNITVLNPFCKIDSTFNYVFPGNATIICHRNSTAIDAVKDSNCTVELLPDIDISELDITVSKNKNSSSSDSKPKITVSYFGNKLKSGVHYTVTYINDYSGKPSKAVIKGISLNSCFTGEVTINLQTKSPVTDSSNSTNTPNIVYKEGKTSLFGMLFNFDIA